MARTPPLPQIRSLVAVAAHGRLNRAADALGLTESAVSHHLRKLEDTLGVRLVDRTRSPVVLTPAGERFHARAREALHLLGEAVREIGGPGTGQVLLTLARTLATHWLVPRYPDLHRHDEALELQLLPTTRLCDLEREQIDLGIRLGDGRWPGLVSRPLLAECICPVAAPEAAREWRRQGWDAMAARRRLVVNETHPEEWSQWCEATGRGLPANASFTRLESFDLVLQAGLAGSALTMGRSPMVDDAVARGDLVAPFPEPVETGLSYHVVWPERRPPNRHARQVLEWLARSVDEGPGDRPNPARRRPADPRCS